jgi:hypothetical protein
VPWPAKAVASLKDLPDAVQTLLANSRPGTGGMADIGGEFNATDVIVDASIPQSRFVSATAGPDCWRVTVERGGRGYHLEELDFTLADHEWVQTGKKTLRPQRPLRPESLAQ